MAGDFLSKTRTFFAATGGIYVVAVLALMIPYIQSHVLYLNAFKFPLFAEYDAPEKYGLSPNKTYNFKIETPDNESLGAWFIFADPFYHSLPQFPTSPDQYIGTALKKHPTILFLHGNAATRAFHVRVQYYQAFSSRLSSNVLAVDYRGFADSSGTPTEAGVVCDVRAAWDWLISQGAKGEDILIVGHSLGTGIGSRLAANLSDEGVKYRGLVLLSPFSSIAEVLETYHILGLVPLMKPLAIIPGATNLVAWALTHKFDTLSVVPQIKGDILIAHAENDWDIPYRHSVVLFHRFLEPLLPSANLPPPGTILSPEEYAYIDLQLAARAEARKQIVLTQQAARFGTVEEFTDGQRTVTYVQTLHGKHDYLGVQEGLQDVIGRKFALL